MKPELLHKPPRGVFRGVNFMTPHILAYYRGIVGGRIVYVELAEGEGFDREPIFGATFRYANGERLDPDPLGVFGSVKNAHLHIAGIVGLRRKPRPTRRGPKPARP